MFIFETSIIGHRRRREGARGGVHHPPGRQRHQGAQPGHPKAGDTAGHRRKLQAGALWVSPKKITEKRSAAPFFLQSLIQHFLTGKIPPLFFSARFVGNASWLRPIPVYWKATQASGGGKSAKSPFFSPPPTFLSHFPAFGTIRGFEWLRRGSRNRSGRRRRRRRRRRCSSNNFAAPTTSRAKTKNFSPPRSPILLRGMMHRKFSTSGALSPRIPNS